MLLRRLLFVMDTHHSSGLGSPSRTQQPNVGRIRASSALISLIGRSASPQHVGPVDFYGPPWDHALGLVARRGKSWAAVS